MGKASDIPSATAGVRTSKCRCSGCCICGDHPKFDLEECPRCGGSGEIAVRGYSHNPNCGFATSDPQEDREMPCSVCHGRGVLHTLAAEAYRLGWIGEAAA